MSAEIVAKMVQELQRRRLTVFQPVLQPGENEDDAWSTLDYFVKVGSAVAQVGEVIDASAMVPEVNAWTTEQQRKQQTDGRVIVGYTEATAGLTLAPPWKIAAIGYSHGDTHGLICMFDVEEDSTKQQRVVDEWDTDDVTIEWDRVKWSIRAMVFPYDPDPTCGLFGPAATWNIPVYEDGTAAYVWCKTTAEGSYVFDLMVLLNTLNICNASNVYLDVPKRPRAMQRRMERTGVRVSEIHVRSIKTAYRGTKGAPLQPGVPLTSVRGHFAHYGPKYNRGLLFGHIEGKFWIPQHIRGTEDCGTVEHSYTVES